MRTPWGKAKNEEIKRLRITWPPVPTASGLAGCVLTKAKIWANNSNESIFSTVIVALKAKNGRGNIKRRDRRLEKVIVLISGTDAIAMFRIAC